MSGVFAPEPALLPLKGRQRNELSGYPLIRKPTWPVKHHSPIYIFHEQLLVNAQVPPMPPMALCRSLTRLCATAADKERDSQDNT